MMSRVGSDGRFRHRQAKEQAPADRMVTDGAVKGVKAVGVRRVRRKELRDGDDTERLTRSPVAIGEVCDASKERLPTVQLIDGDIDRLVVSSGANSNGRK